MKIKNLILGIMLLISFSSFGQSHLGYVTKQVNFRAGPSITDSILISLPPGLSLFIISLLTENDYYNVIDIESNLEGYVHKSYVKVADELPENTEGIFPRVEKHRQLRLK